MSRFARKKDANHNGIADGLRADGWYVMDLSACGHGIPDMLVGRPRTDVSLGIVVPLEVKNKDGKGVALTEAEQRVRDNWTGPYIVALSLDDARAQLKALEDTL